MLATVTVSAAPWICFSGLPQMQPVQAGEVLHVTKLNKIEAPPR